MKRALLIWGFGGWLFLPLSYLAVLNVAFLLFPTFKVGFLIGSDPSGGSNEIFIYFLCIVQSIEATILGVATLAIAHWDRALWSRVVGFFSGLIVSSCTLFLAWSFIETLHRMSWIEQTEIINICLASSLPIVWSLALILASVFMRNKKHRAN